MEIFPATSQDALGRAPQGGAQENHVLNAAIQGLLLALLHLLCRNLGLVVTAPAEGWSVPLLLQALASIRPALRARRHPRTPELRPFIPRCERRGSPELAIVNAYRLPPVDPWRPLRRLPLRPRQGRGPPARAHSP
jgi:hypothetical protein